MEHYVCTGGCGGVSNEAGVCQTEGCVRFGQPLHECGCEDNMHEGLTNACKDCGELCKQKGGCQVEEFKTEIEA
ncbi:MAG: hypothetical protein WC795_00120 [Candidatus Paceibacterota bacterium]|jgi:hypothetical protein